MRVSSLSEQGDPTMSQPKSEKVQTDILSVGANNINSEFNQYMEYYAQLLKAELAKKIVIVEDDPFSQKILESSIRQLAPSAHCIHASSEEEVTNILNLVNCDLIISDFYLEGAKTGLDICDKIHEFFPATKCLIVSKLSFNQYREIAQRSQAPPSFIEKPVSLGVMKEYLSEIFKEEQHVRR